MLIFLRFLETHRKAVVVSVLGTIFVGGAFLRLWGLGSAEIFHDEGLYAFRSIGYVDYLQNDQQSTPIQWFKDAPILPFWTHLSFHDHPPLFFIVQHFFFVLFGESLFVARLPSVVAGLLSIILVYFIAKRLAKNEVFALFAAALLAVNHIHVWLSRSSLLEALLLFFIFLSFWSFLRYLENERSWWIFGISLGAILLTKYTGGIVIPLYVLYLFIFRRERFRSLRLLGISAIALLMVSPVLIYNFFLLKTVGHFDLQLSFLFGQAVPEWAASIGKLQSPFWELPQNLFAMYSIPFLVAVLGGIVFSFMLWGRTRSPYLFFGWGGILTVTLLLIIVGSAYRFLGLYVPFFITFVVIAFAYCYRRWGASWIFMILAVSFLVYESVFTVQSLFFEFPDFGIVRLDRYLDSVFDGKRSSTLPVSSNPYLNAIIKSSAERYPQGDKPWLLIYDENLSLPPRLWVFTRRLLYHGIPTVTPLQFKALLKERGAEALKGYEVVFAKAEKNTYLNPFLNTPDAAELQHFLSADLHLTPAVISDARGREMFKVFRFTL